jgi:hypothetical protein
MLGNVIMDPLTFRQFCKLFKEDDDPIGDVVRDMFEDTDFPWNYVDGRIATASAIARFEELKACEKAKEAYEKLCIKYHEYRRIAQPVYAITT